MEIKHKFVSKKADGKDSSLIKPSNWNDGHAIVMNGKSLLGRSEKSKGDADEIALGANLAMVNKTLTLTADIDFDALVANSLYQG
jgi:hypothetical protein